MLGALLFPGNTAGPVATRSRRRRHWAQTETEKSALVGALLQECRYIKILFAYGLEGRNGQSRCLLHV